jgi:hypothetical protein
VAITYLVVAGWQPLARMGATVTATDAVDKNIKIASVHAVCIYFQPCKLLNGCKYVCFLESYFDMLRAQELILYYSFSK